MSTLIVYYSYSGNTRKIAEDLRGLLGADLAEIRTISPYPGSYDAVVDQGRSEVDQGYLPPIHPLEHDPAGYDVVFLGTPVWWYTFAPAVKSFLRQYDLSGKKVCPFMTNGGWLGHTEKDIASACPGADVRPGIDIRFDGARQATSGEAVRQWAANI